MNQFNISKITSFLSSGFDENEQTDFFLDPYISVERNQAMISSKNEIIHLLDNQFDETIDYIKQLSNSTGKEIILALSGGVDSLIIYQLLSKSGINFKAINIGYDQGFNEVESIREYIGSGKNIEYKMFRSSGSLANLDAIKFKYLVSHPTLISYYNLISSLKDDSLLITGDIADEIFGLEPRMTDNYKDTIFTRDEIERLLNIHVTPSQDDDLYQDSKSIISPDIDIGYNNVTYKMIANCMVNKDILYYPFFSGFYKFITGISNFSINDSEKSYLRNYLLNRLGVQYDKKKQGFKYPILDSVLEEYLIYIKQNNGASGCFIDIEYLENILSQQNMKSKRWKLFTLVVLLKLIKDNDYRLLKNKEIIESP